MSDEQEKTGSIFTAQQIAQLTFGTMVTETMPDGTIRPVDLADLFLMNECQCYEENCQGLTDGSCRMHPGVR